MFKLKLNINVVKIIISSNLMNYEIGDIDWNISYSKFKKILNNGNNSLLPPIKLHTSSKMPLNCTTKGEHFPPRHIALSPSHSLNIKEWGWLKL